LSEQAGWIGSVLGDVLAQMRERQAEAEAHAASCTERPCERCERFVCKCGQAVDVLRQCRACAERDANAALMAPTHRSVPQRFKWALEGGTHGIEPRVRAPFELIRRGLHSPPSTSLLFIGPTGAGKTSLAVAMLDSWVRLEPRKRTGAIFVEAAYLARARARHRLGADEAPLVADCLTAPLVLLDDLGQEREDRDGCITDVVYGRANADLPTWVTCGLSTPEHSVEAFAAKLSQRYDGGFVRRIVEHGKCVTLGAR
jgi:DNA replication protein DnaC